MGVDRTRRTTRRARASESRLQSKMVREQYRPVEWSVSAESPRRSSRYKKTKEHKPVLNGSCKNSFPILYVVGGAGYFSITHFKLGLSQSPAGNRDKMGASNIYS